MEPKTRPSSPYEAIKSDIVSLQGKLEAAANNTHSGSLINPAEVTKNKMIRLGTEEVLSQLGFVKEQVDSLSRL